MIMMMFLQNMRTQAESTTNDLGAELLDNGYLTQANAHVGAAETALKKVEQNSGSTAGQIEAAITNLQREQSKAGFIQGEMSQVFSTRVNPDQQLIQQDESMFGAANQENMRTERTRR
jgi:hypothetical protein